MNTTSAISKVDSESAARPLRIGAVSYLNSKPLIWHLGRELPDATRSLDLPSRLADRLAEGLLDVALVPIVEYFRQGHSRQVPFPLGDFGQGTTQLISSACIACEGPVWSVKVYFRKPPAEVATLALDEGSRTSAALAQILLHHAVEVRPQLRPLPIGVSPDRARADAVLVIGDRAMQTPSADYVETWDLGQRWFELTGLPFVFAAWVARDLESDADGLAAHLDAARDAGVASIDEIAKIESMRVGLTVVQAKHYLQHYLRYTLGDRERDAIMRFRKECVSLGLI